MFCCSCRGEVFPCSTWSEKLCCKLPEGCYTVQRRLQFATIVAKSRTGILTSCNVARNNNNNNKRCVASCRGSCYTPQFFCNLQRNSIALQVVGKIAQCNGALMVTGTEIPPISVRPKGRKTRSYRQENHARRRKVLNLFLFICDNNFSSFWEITTVALL